MWAWASSDAIAGKKEGLMAENDWEGFRKLTERLEDKIEIVGDDLFVANTKYIARGIAEKSANAVLIKLNQIGSVSETIEAIAMCQDAGWRYFISHHSGETENDFLADFVVAMNGVVLGNALAAAGRAGLELTRLLEIEAELGGLATYYWK